MKAVNSYMYCRPTNGRVSSGLRHRQPIILSLYVEILTSKKRYVDVLFTLEFHFLSFNFCELMEEALNPATEDEKEPDVDRANILSLLCF